MKKKYGFLEREDVVYWDMVILIFVIFSLGIFKC